ncbi:hypothetical protein AG1IA_08402 [Rhizoctonia solani AG-1 IA]|uniref:Uncharacterized protein n=1 Tax=Thanatephorus cucumeris (strain AG1-IA) TaxID=983506 RepID=L8WLD6_THACA|nr:hypothetical protein AG1IA_08402 [Rhizoctonia solani AG-1 IA]
MCIMRIMRRLRVGGNKERRCLSVSGDSNSWEFKLRWRCLWSRDHIGDSSWGHRVVVVDHKEQLGNLTSWLWFNKGFGEPVFVDVPHTMGYLKFILNSSRDNDRRSDLQGTRENRIKRA